MTTEIRIRRVDSRLDAGPVHGYIVSEPTRIVGEWKDLTVATNLDQLTEVVRSIFSEADKLPGDRVADAIIPYIRRSSFKGFGP